MSQKFSGVLVKPLADQRDEDWRIDPAGVSFVPGTSFPILDNFQYDKVLGSGWARRAEDGSVVVFGELNESGAAYVRHEAKLAIGVVTGKTVRRKDEPSLVNTSKLSGFSLTRDHQDATQPPIRLLDEFEDEK